MHNGCKIPGIFEEEHQIGVNNNNVVDTTFAELVCPWELCNSTLGKTIGPGPIDLVLSCKRGLFSGRFFYVSRTPDGEILGSDRNDDSISVLIDNAGLSPKHCKVTFQQDSLKYFLTDLGSESGTWVRLRYDRGISLEPDQTIFLNGVLLKVRSGASLIDGLAALDEFLRCYDLLSLKNRLLKLFRLLNVNASLKNLNEFNTSFQRKLLEDSSVSAEEHAIFTIALFDLPNHFLPVETKSCSLCLVDCFDEAKVYAEVGAVLDGIASSAYVLLHYQIRWTGGYLCPVSSSAQLNDELLNHNFESKNTQDEKEKSQTFKAAEMFQTNNGTGDATFSKQGSHDQRNKQSTSISCSLSHNSSFENEDINCSNKSYCPTISITNLSLDVDVSDNDYFNNNLLRDKNTSDFNNQRPSIARSIEKTPVADTLKDFDFHNLYSRGQNSDRDDLEHVESFSQKEDQYVKKNLMMGNSASCSFHFSKAEDEERLDIKSKIKYKIEFGKKQEAKSQSVWVNASFEPPFQNAIESSLTQERKVPDGGTISRNPATFSIAKIDRSYISLENVGSTETLENMEFQKKDLPFDVDQKVVQSNFDSQSERSKPAIESIDHSVAYSTSQQPKHKNLAALVKHQVRHSKSVPRYAKTKAFGEPFWPLDESKRDKERGFRAFATCPNSPLKELKDIALCAVRSRIREKTLPAQGLQSRCKNLMADKNSVECEAASVNSRNPTDFSLLSKLRTRSYSKTGNVCNRCINSTKNSVNLSSSIGTLTTSILDKNRDASSVSQACFSLARTPNQSTTCQGTVASLNGDFSQKIEAAIPFSYYETVNEQDCSNESHTESQSELPLPLNPTLKNYPPAFGTSGSNERVERYLYRENSRNDGVENFVTFREAFISERSGDPVHKTANKANKFHNLAHEPWRENLDSSGLSLHPIENLSPLFSSSKHSSRSEPHCGNKKSSNYRRQSPFIEEIKSQPKIPSADGLELGEVGYTCKASKKKLIKHSSTIISGRHGLDGNRTCDGVTSISGYYKSYNWRGKKLCRSSTQEIQKPDSHLGSGCPSNTHQYCRVTTIDASSEVTKPSQTSLVSFLTPSKTSENESNPTWKRISTVSNMFPKSKVPRPLKNPAIALSPCIATWRPTDSILKGHRRTPQLQTEATHLVPPPMDILDITHTSSNLEKLHSATMHEISSDGLLINNQQPHCEQAEISSVHLDVENPQNCLAEPSALQIPPSTTGLSGRVLFPLGNSDTISMRNGHASNLLLPCTNIVDGSRPRLSLTSTTTQTNNSKKIISELAVLESSATRTSKESSSVELLRSSLEYSSKSTPVTQFPSLFELQQREAQDHIAEFAGHIDRWVAHQEEFSSTAGRFQSTPFNSLQHTPQPSPTLSTASMLRQHFQVLLSTTKRFYAGRLFGSEDSVRATSHVTPSETVTRTSSTPDSASQVLNAQFCPTILPVDHTKTPVPPMGLTLQGVPLPIPNLVLYGTGSTEMVGGLPGALFLSPDKYITGEAKRCALDLLNGLTDTLIRAANRHVWASELHRLKADGIRKEDTLDKLKLVARVREWLSSLRDLNFFEKLEQAMSKIGMLPPYSQRPLLSSLTPERLNSILTGITPSMTPETPEINVSSLFDNDSNDLFPVRPIFKLPKACGTAMNLTVKYINGRYELSITEINSPFEAPTRTKNDVLERLFVKLRPHIDVHHLTPGDVIRLGTLEFAALRFNTGVGGHQGFRNSMEDEELCIQDIYQLGDGLQCSYFAVYDGHGGRQCAEFIHNRLHLSFKRQLYLISGRLGLTTSVHRDIYDALFRAFLQSDRHFLRHQEQQSRRTGPGCAAIVIVILGDSLWAANCGDARAVLCRNGVAVSLSCDHKPIRDDEVRRIETSGGFVKSRRVLGRLAVSRAFGDIEYKNVACGKPPLVVADPEIRMERLTPADEFLLLACDGLFDVFTSQEAVNFIRRRLSAMPLGEQEPQSVVEELIREAIELRRSRDNVTAILVTFKRNIRLQASFGRYPLHS